MHVEPKWHSRLFPFQISRGQFHKALSTHFGAPYTKNGVPNNKMLYAKLLRTLFEA